MQQDPITTDQLTDHEEITAANFRAYREKDRCWLRLWSVVIRALTICGPINGACIAGLQSTYRPDQMQYQDFQLIVELDNELKKRGFNVTYALQEPQESSYVAIEAFRELAMIPYRVKITW